MLLQSEAPRESYAAYLQLRLGEASVAGFLDEEHERNGEKVVYTLLVVQSQLLIPPPAAHHEVLSGATNLQE